MVVMADMKRHNDVISFKKDMVRYPFPPKGHPYSSSIS